MTLLDLATPSTTTSTGATAHSRTGGGTRGARSLVAALAAVTVTLFAASLFVGAGSLSWDLLWISRLPRTTATLLAGAAMAVNGLLMQLLVRNRFVEPATVGTTESAGAGLLLATIVAPGLSVAGKMGVAVIAALAGTALFLLVLRGIAPQQQLVVVPLAGLMLSGIVSSVTTFVALEWDLLQSMTMWMTGDFSAAMRGRVELLWLVAVMMILTWLWAERFTVAGMGRDHATNLGLSYRQIMVIGLALVAISSAVCVVVVGALPFLGLVVPHLAGRLLGDNLRRSLPVVALSGAAFLLLCDIAARSLNHPYEIPVGIIVGVVGAAAALTIVLRRGGPR